MEDERHKLDQRLRDQQFYTRSLIESNVDALMACDIHGMLINVLGRAFGARVCVCVVRECARGRMYVAVQLGPFDLLL